MRVKRENLSEERERTHLRIPPTSSSSAALSALAFCSSPSSSFSLASASSRSVSSSLRRAAETSPPEPLRTSPCWTCAADADDAGEPEPVLLARSSPKRAKMSAGTGALCGDAPGEARSTASVGRLERRGTTAVFSGSTDMRSPSACDADESARTAMAVVVAPVCTVRRACSRAEGGVPGAGGAGGADAPRRGSGAVFSRTREGKGAPANGRGAGGLGSVELE